MVDDNKNGLTARKAVLTELGFEITTATSPSLALEKHPEMNFDLVITDHRLPKIDGVAFIAAVRKIKPSICVILLSGYVEGMGLTENSTGSDVVIQKNANELPHLTRSVNRLLRRATKKPPSAHSKVRARAAGAGS